MGMLKDCSLDTFFVGVRVRARLLCVLSVTKHLCVLRAYRVASSAAVPGIPSVFGSNDTQSCVMCSVAHHQRCAKVSPFEELARL